MNDMNKEADLQSDSLHEVENAEKSQSYNLADAVLDPERAAREKELARKILWKTDFRIIPMLAVMYCCCFLDRSNVGNAKILGLTQDLKLDSHQWAVALAVFYVFYVLAEIPSSLLLKKITPRLWLALLGFICGLLGMCVAFVRNYAGFVAIRIILGLFEGGLLPGIIIYFSGMYTRGELALRLGIFYVSASIAGAFSGLLARGLAEIPPRGIIDDGWRWILLIEGLLTMVVAVIVCVLLPNNIGDAWYLTPEEQEFGARRLHLDIAARLEREPLSEKLDWKEVRRAALSVRTWAMAVIIICVLSGIYSFSIFLPTIIKGLGYTANAAQLWSVIPYAVASVVTVVVSVLSDRLRLRGPFVMFTLTIGIIGYASIAYIDKQHVKAKYGMTMLMATGLYATTPPVLAWIANNAAGHYKRAASIGIMMAFGNCGGFIGSFIYPAEQAPQYVTSNVIILSLLILAWVVTGLNMLHCAKINRDKAAGKYDQYAGFGDDRDPTFKLTL